MISIIDYQAGNLRSVQKALEKAGAKAVITSDAQEIENSEGLIFPGQGANDSSMKALKSRELVEPIKRFIAGGKPFLGVCLGLQLLLEGSDEGVEPGLGVVPGRVRQIPVGFKIPHMGWNRVVFRKSSAVLRGLPQGAYFYFVHSYYADPEDSSLVAATTGYGIEFCSAITWDNVTALQFHPEKSGDLGLMIYENFATLVNCGK